MIPSTRLRLNLAWSLVLAVLLDTAVHLFLKIAVTRVPDDAPPWEMAQAMIGQPIVILSVVLMLIQLFNWLNVLASADLSFAQPITALTYVLIFVLSVLWLGERLDGLKIAGTATVLAGVWCVSWTERPARSREGAAT